MFGSASAFVHWLKYIAKVFSRDIHHTRRFTKMKPGTNLFNGDTSRLLLSSDAAYINKGRESNSTSIDLSVQCM